MRSKTLWIALACGLMFAACGSESGDDKEKAGGKDATDGTPKAPAVAEIGKPVRPFQTKDAAGNTFDLAKSGYSAEEARAAVLAAAKAHGAGDDAGDDTLVAELSGVQEDGEVDEDLVQTLVNQAGEPFGLQASVEKAATLKTLGDVTAWVAAGSSQPIVFMVWSPGCPTSRKLNDEIMELVQNTGVRLYAIGGNHADTAAIFAKFKDAFDFPVRIFLDPKQVVVDTLGGKRTPHFMLVDGDGVLRYRGGLHNNVPGLLDEGDIENWLADAIAAVQQGKDVPVTESDAVG